MKSNGLYFLQPLSDQVVSIARLIHEAAPSVALIAVTRQTKKERAACFKLGYTDAVSEDSLNSDYKSLSLVPAGAQSTEELLRIGPVVIGDVTMEPSVLRVYDKKWFVAHCLKSGLPVPKTYTGISEIHDTDFPIFYKQKHEQGGGARGLARSRTEVPNDNAQSLIYQEYIDSPGTYGVGFIAVNGVIEVRYSHYEVCSYPKDGGSAVVVRPCQDGRLIELTESIVKSLSYSGWGLAEYKYCPKRKDYVFMEINAKFWASCELAFRNEPDFLGMLFGVSREKEDLKGLVFVNRALQLGLFPTIKVLWSSRDCSCVKYPGIFRSFVLGVLPSPIFNLLRKVRRNGVAD